VPGGAGPSGPPGAAGSPGATGFVSTSTFSGFANSAFASVSYRFFGPTVAVTATAGQRMTGSAMVPIAVTAGGPIEVQLDLLRNLRDQQHTGGVQWQQLLRRRSDDRAVVVRRHGIRGARCRHVGVGACVVTASTIADNNFVNGWVQVTNSAGAKS
jgi:hypothetical protein